MTAIEQLQQLGLNKYEAEAYYTLLTHKPLTGYEVGKHSQVPASRSYEIVEKLVEKGLAQVQPGDPPRYMAQDPGQFLARIRSEMEETLDSLTDTLTSLPDQSDEYDFWIIRGQRNILERLQNLIRTARTSVDLSIATINHPLIHEELTQARARGCAIYLRPLLPGKDTASLIALRDDQEAFVGMLTPADSCQAVVSGNTGLVGTLHGYFATLRDLPPLLASVPIPSSAMDTTWIDWETRKQQRLWRLSHSQRSIS